MKQKNICICLERVNKKYVISFSIILRSPSFFILILCEVKENDRFKWMLNLVINIEISWISFRRKKSIFFNCNELAILDWLPVKYQTKIASVSVVIVI